MYRKVSRICMAAAILACSTGKAVADNCTSAQSTFAKKIEGLAMQYTKKALASVPKQSNVVDVRFTMWFGKNSADHAEKVMKTLNNILASEKARIEYLCEPHNTQDCKNNEKPVAFVNPTKPYDINLCKKFFVSGNDDQRAALLVHELSHFDVVGKTRDHCKNTPDCKKLARTDPEKAILTAYSYQAFVYAHK